MSENKKLSIFIATLEGSILSYSVDFNQGVISPMFTAKDHIGRIKAIHCTPEGRLITAGEDENMKIYNYLSKKSLSTVVGIVGIPVKIFSTKKFIVSSQENGQVYVLGKKDGSIYHVIKAFKTGLKNIAIHESGKLMLCLSRSNRFAVWNLMTCSMIFHKKIKAEIEALDFFGDDSILFSTSNCMYLYSMSEMKFIQEIKVEEGTKINDIQILKTWAGKWVIVACENGYVYFYNERNFVADVEDFSFVKFKAYEKRVKKIKVSENILVTISTDGDITIWDISSILEKNEIEEQLNIEEYCSLLDYKVVARPILLDINLREIKVEPLSDEVEAEKVTKNEIEAEESDEKVVKLEKKTKVQAKKIKKQNLEFKKNK